MQSLDFHVPYTPNELVPGTMKRKFDIGRWPNNRIWHPPEVWGLIEVNNSTGYIWDTFYVFKNYIFEWLVSYKLQLMESFLSLADSEVSAML